MSTRKRQTYCDKAGLPHNCVIYLQSVSFVCIGAGMIGHIENSGIGQPVECEQLPVVEGLWETHSVHNKALVQNLSAPWAKEGANAEWLLNHTMEEAKLGRMSWPMQVGVHDLEGWLLQPRYLALVMKESLWAFLVYCS